MRATFAIITLACGLGPSLAAARSILSRGDVYKPAVEATDHLDSDKPSVKLTEEMLLKIAPNAKTCNRKTDFPDHCTTAKDAVPLLVKGFEKYGITTAGEYASLLALSAFESVDFLYRLRATAEGRAGDGAGQGTSNMQKYPSNYEYALAIGGGVAKSTKDIVGSAAAPTDEQKNKVVALLITDNYNFESAAWYYKNKCSDTVKEEVRKGTLKGHQAYLTDCVQTTTTKERETYFSNAQAAFGLKG